jgi:hypothetical protein
VPFLKQKKIEFNASSRNVSMQSCEFLFWKKHRLMRMALGRTWLSDKCWRATPPYEAIYQRMNFRTYKFKPTLLKNSQ